MAAVEGGTEKSDADGLYEIGRRVFFGDVEGSAAAAAPDAATALGWYQRAAEAGSVRAMKELGRCYRHGWGTAINDAAAQPWLRRAADGGDAYSLGHCFFYGIGCTADRAAALEWDRKAAESNDPAGLNSLAYYYAHGSEGVAADQAHAVSLYEAGAAQRDPISLSNLASCYRDGKGVQADNGRADALFREAIRYGDTRSVGSLGSLLLTSGRGTAEAALALFVEGARRGDTLSTLNAAYAYYTGTGTAKNHPETARLYLAAAEAGDATAMANLACLYRDGHGVAEDMAQAITWFRRAAEAGRASAMASLGWCYETGKGVERNAVKAFEWYQKAALAGDVVGMTNLGYSYANAQGVERNYEQALSWYRRAADLGYSSAMNNVGFCYSHGRGVSIDHAAAAKWFERAAIARSAIGMNNLADSYSHGRGVPVDPAAAAAWYCRAGETYQANGDMRRAIEYYELAAKKDYLPAMTRLGMCYQAGFTDSPPSHEEAARWYRRAAGRGDSEAMCRMGNLLEAGIAAGRFPVDAVNVFRTEALRLYRAAAALGHAAARDEAARLELAHAHLGDAVEVILGPSNKLVPLAMAVEGEGEGDDSGGSSAATLMCAICQSNPRTQTVLPCGHFALCDECAADSRLGAKCPFDKVRIDDRLTTYIVPNRPGNDGGAEDPANSMSAAIVAAVSMGILGTQDAPPVLRCLVCNVAARTRTCSPCGHVVACDACAVGLVWCPHPPCRRPVAQFVRTYIP